METPEFNRRKSQLANQVALLLSGHDCVILPGFGGLIGNYTATRVHPVTHLFQPPSKQLVFNRHLRSDDGLLANALAGQLNLSFTDARTWLADTCTALQERLYAGERMELPLLGVLRMDIERNISFIPDSNENYLPAAYGLYSIQAQPINRHPIPERRPKREFVSRERVLPAPALRRFPWKRRLLQAIPLLAIAVSALLNFNTIPGNKPVETLKINPFELVAAPEPVALAVREDRVKPAIRRAIVPKTEEFSAENAQIYIVAGCYSTESNAQGMINYLVENGFDAYILDRTPAGLFRVVYGYYPDVTSASIDLSLIRKGFNEEAWLLVR